MKKELQNACETSAKTASGFLVDSVETLQKKLKEVRAAQKIFAEY